MYKPIEEEYTLKKKIATGIMGDIYIVENKKTKNIKCLKEY